LSLFKIGTYKQQRFFVNKALKSILLKRAKNTH
jgi:hypothetical protein